jgi:aminopeptidase N
MMMRWLCPFILVTLAAEAQDLDRDHGPWHSIAPNADIAAQRSSASTNFDARYYHLDFEIRFNPRLIIGRTRIAGDVVSGSLSRLDLDFTTQPAMRVDSVRSTSGSALGFAHIENILSIDLGAAHGAGSAIDVEVFYRGLPRQTGFGTFTFGTLSNGDPFAWSLSQPYGAREWWPGVDHPTDKADSVRVTITVPQNMLAGSNGLLEAQRIENGLATYTWFHRYPIASYLVSFAAGIYEVRNQVYQRPTELAELWGELELPIEHFVYRGSPAFEGTAINNGWQRVVDVMRVFENWFGPYPFPEEKYGHKHVTFGGGMEHQTMSSMGGFSVGLIAHELGHQWYGNLVTNRRWPELWLNEGFATYSELLYWEARRDLYPGTFEANRDFYRTRARQAIGPLIVQDTLSINNLFNSARVYAKGGIVLHMLRWIVDDDTFRQILRTYSYDDAVRYGTATTADFQRVAEDVSGRDLAAFFAQWVTDGTGYPVYDVRWGYEHDQAGYLVTVEVSQTQTLPLSNVETFVMPLPLAVVTTQGEVPIRVENTERQQRFTFVVPAPPTGLIFDPDRWLLRNETVQVLDFDGVPLGPDSNGLANLHPNPAPETFSVTIEIAHAGPALLELYDVSGRRLATLLDQALPFGAHPFEFDVRGVAPGRYFLRLTTGNGRSTTPLSVVR